jgi:uncharacterized membrane-anchored protein
LQAEVASAQDQQQPLTDEQIAQEFDALGWLGAGVHQLAQSNSTLTLPDGYQLVLGAGARRVEELVGDVPAAETEARVISEDFSEDVVFQFFDVGYVTLDDWEDVDAESLLEATREGTEEGNEHRREAGISAIHVVGWLKEPTLERATNTVYWAIQVDDEDPQIADFVNSVALRLGRNGYEKLIWITDLTTYSPTGGTLDTMLAAHSFNSGSRYQDYVSGDRTAGYGIAALVGALAGGKLIQAGFFAAALIFLKKFGIFIFIGIGALLTQVKRLFRRSSV